MPQVIVTAIAYYAGWISTAQFIFAVALAAYGTYAQSTARRKARNAYNESLKDRLISVPVVDAARARVYGRVRCADGIIYKATHGTNKENFTLVLALAGHEIDAVEQIYFNDQAITVDAAGYVTSAPWLKTSVTSGRQVIGAGGTSTTLPADAILSSVGVSTEGSNGDRVAQQAISFALSGNTVTPDNVWTSVVRNVTYQVGSTASKARVRAFNGAPGQDLSTVLAGLPGITSAHRFAGIACLVIDLVYDQDAFPMGPPNVSAVVRGARLFDPRTSTTAWTENPALIARDWALYANGGGASLAELDATSFVAAANACDVAQSFTTVNAAGATSTQVLPLYTAGLVARTDQAPDEVLSEICSAMAGRWAWAGGRLRVRAGTYTAPVATLTEDWVSSAGEIDVVSTVPRTELFNVVVPSIANAAQAYVVAPIPRIAPAAFITADGGEYPRDVTLAAVTDTAHAAHVCGVMLRDSRQALTVSLTCNMRALALELFDVVAVTLPRFGWDAKPFEVLGWAFSQEGGIKLTLKETDASIYQPDASFSRSDAAPNTALPNPYAVPGVSPSSITSGNAQLLRQADGTILSRIRVAWAAVQDEAVRNGGTIEVRYGPADSDPSTYQTETVAGAETQALLTGVQDGRVYAIATRARNKLVAGQWSIQVLHVVQGKSAPPSNVTSLAATGAPGALRITWAPCPDADYALTELRVGTSWATATRIWRGAGSSFEWVTGAGAYNVLARHEDTTGNLSSAVVGASGTALVSDTDSAAAALAAANAAQGTANTASTNATNALNRIAAIDSDGILARGEKAATILDWQALQDEEAGIVARANGFGIVTERDQYTSSKSALATYLSGLSPSWNDTSQDTTIVPAVYRANWADVYAKRQALLNRIAEVAGQRATWANVASRPGNLAGLSGSEVIRNDQLALSNTGVLTSAGTNQGQISTITTVDNVSERDINRPPSWYPVGTTREFKLTSALGLAGDLWCTLETIIQYSDDSGGRVYQYAYVGQTTWRRFSNGRSNSSWTGAWVQDLDRNAYTGDLNATAGMNLLSNGTFETGVSDWMPKHVSNFTATMTAVQVSDAWAGSTVMELGSQGAICVSSRAVPVTPGATYRVRFRFRALDATVATYWYYGATAARPADGYNGFNDSTIWAPLPNSGVPSFVAPSSNWQTYSEVLTIPTGMRWLSLGLHRWSDSSAGARLQIDDVALSEYTGDLNAESNSRITVNGGVLQGIGTAGVQVDNSFAPIGQNLIPNSDQSAAITYGQGVNAAHGVGISLTYARFIWGSLYTLIGGTTQNLTYQQQGPSAGGDGFPTIDFYPTGGWNQATAIPVVPGQRYCMSAYLQAHRCNVGVCLQFYDIAGNATTGLIEAGPTYTGEGFADTLAAYLRVHAMWVAPAGSAVCRVAIRKYNTFAGQGNSYIWMAAPQFEAVSANAIGPSPYQPGPAQSTRQLGYTGDLAATRNDVYRQATDPGAVPDGSIWLNTTTGRALQRVAGAWQPYVGPGSVATGEIAADSVTVVSTSFLAGPVSEANDL